MHIHKTSHTSGALTMHAHVYIYIYIYMSPLSPPLSTY